MVSIFFFITTVFYIYIYKLSSLVHLLGMRCNRLMASLGAGAEISSQHCYSSSIFVANDGSIQVDAHIMMMHVICMSFTV